MVSYQGQTLLHAQIASLFNSEINNHERISGLINFTDSEQVYIDFTPPGSFPIFKFENIIAGKEDLTQFQDQLVLIGDDLNLAGRDYAPTPFNHDAVMTVTELHANMFDTLIRNSAPMQQPPWQNFLLTLFISTLTLFVVLNLRPLQGLAILTATACGFSFLCWFAFWNRGIWVEMAHPLLAIFICYYFFIPYRLIVENRISWEYYQKNRLLSQVEELKTNFISMMSHDLKTPIARIQGMTEVLAKDNVALSPQQTEAVDTIRSSAGDLLGFVNSILNYARLESQGVTLQLKACDLNGLLQDVVQRHQFLADRKHMQIQTEFEPLFSISVDPELLKQVFSNLLENAIKYSPEHSQVKIRSSESGDSIKIEFSDQGPGISEDEMPNIFMKFFRSKNAKSSPIKGSGLGLYLAKYFTELHKGHIFVTSTPGKGSTFTVQLPLLNS